MQSDADTGDAFLQKWEEAAISSWSENAPFPSSQIFCQEKESLFAKKRDMEARASCLQMKALTLAGCADLPFSLSLGQEVCLSFLFCQEIARKSADREEGHQKFNQSMVKQHAPEGSFGRASVFCSSRQPCTTSCMCWRHVGPRWRPGLPKLPSLGI